MVVVNGVQRGSATAVAERLLSRVVGGRCGLAKMPIY